MNAAGGEDGGFDVPPRVGGLGVQRPSFLVQRPERRLVLCEGAVAAPDPPPGLLRRRSRRGWSARDFAARRGSAVPTAPPPSATTDGVPGCSTSSACFDSRRRKAVSPPVSKIRAIGSTLDLDVDVDERPPEACREAFADCGLACAHKPIRAM